MGDPILVTKEFFVNETNIIIYIYIIIYNRVYNIYIYICIYQILWMEEILHQLVAIGKR